MKLKEIYGEIEFDDSQLLIMEDDGIHVLLYHPVFEIPAYGIQVCEGDWLEQNSTTGEWEPDWSLTLVYPIGQPPQEWLYYEQDDILTTLHNYLGDYDEDAEVVVKGQFNEDR